MQNINMMIWYPRNSYEQLANKTTWFIRIVPQDKGKKEERWDNFNKLKKQCLNAEIELDFVIQLKREA